MERLMYAAGVALVAFTAVANDVTIKNGASDWTAGNSYEGGVAPVAGDNVLIPADTCVTLDASDSDSWSLVESLARIIPLADTSVLTVNVASAAKLTTPFAIDTSSADFGDYRHAYSGLGEFVKAGTGNLEIGGATSRFLCSGRRMEYNTRLTVREGTLTLPQNVTTGASLCYGPTTIEAGATVVGITVDPAYASSAWPKFSFYTLSGEGTVTSSGPRPFNVDAVQGKATSVFAGKLSGTLTPYVSGALELTGTESDTTRAFTCYYNGAGSEKGAFDHAWWGGFVRVMKVGRTGYPSSLGAADSFIVGNYGGGIVYLGSGEETDKTFRFSDGSGSLWGYGFIDGGANGGLIWRGPWAIQANASNTKTSQMVILGSNETACVMSGAIEDAVGDDGVGYPLYLIKKGTGTWRMADNAARTGGGGYAIEEGTLQFETIAERGTVCSLGTALNLTDAYSGRDIESHRVDYAYMLGTTNTIGTMEYVGTEPGRCSSRPVAVNGKGRFKVSGTGGISFNGFTAVTDGAELRLDTDLESGVSFGGICDGSGCRLKVVKEGNGSVTLNGESDFSGGLEVREGTVVVTGGGKPVPVYRWFRWIITEKGSFCSRYRDSMGWSTDYSSGVDLQMEEFAMFDADGSRIDRNLQYSPLTSNFDQMPTGTVAQETPLSVAAELNGDGSKIATYFDGGAGSLSGAWGGISMRARVWPFCSMDRPDYWFRLVVHLPENANPAASYDLAGFFGVAENAAACEVTALRIEGSVDGVNWEPVVENDALEIPDTKARWYSRPDDASLVSVDANNVEYRLKDHVGFPMRGTATNIVAAIDTITAPVSVAEGASLVADGDVTLASLRLSVLANGTISGFALAENGTLDVSDFTEGSELLVPVTMVDVIGKGNLANWSLTVNGKAKATRHIRIGNDGNIYLRSRGATVIIR